MAKRQNQKKIITALCLLILIVGTVLLPVYARHDVEASGREEGIRLKGDTVMELAVGEKYSEPGFTAYDSRGKDISGKVVVFAPEMYNSGTYKVTYTYEEGGKTISAERTVKVVLPAQTEEGGKRGLSILMYHNVYDPGEIDEPVNNNYITTDALKEEMDYLVDNGYYFPSWEEVRRFVDGEVDLPEKSVVLTFDDGARDFEKYGIPILEEADIKATAFIVGTNRGEMWVRKDLSHVQLQSHSYDMHKAGGNIGHGGIFTALSYDEAMEDMEKSKELLGTNDAFCYPYGDYTDECEQIVEDAGYKVGLTTNYGKIYPGDDPYALKRIRISGSPSITAFESLL